MFGFVLGKLFKRRVKGFVDESCDVESCIVDMSGSFKKKTPVARTFIGGRFSFY